MYLKRKLSHQIQNTKKSVLILGPRQTGKSTLINELKPSYTINLSDEETYVQHLSSPGLLKHEINNHKIIFIDEVQRIPSLLNTVQALIDQNKELKFYLTGSSARKLKRGKANLLPGRIVSYAVGPLSMSELVDKFNLQRALSVGLLPGVYLEDDLTLSKKVLRSYAVSYLKEEVQAESLTRNLEGFSRFFNVVISKSGDFLDLTKFSNQAMIERMSAKRYFDILVDTLVVDELGPFTKSSKKRLVQHPRYFVFDTGVLNGALSNFEVSADRIGRLFEHLVLQLITSEAKASDIDYRISNYRTDHGVEVDLIFEKKQEIFAIEVKATKTIHSSDLNGLKSFKSFVGKKLQMILIYLGDKPLQIDGVLILPLRESIDLIFSK